MSIDRDRILFGAGVVGVVALLGVFKGAGLVATILSAAAAGVVYVGLDELLGRRAAPAVAAAHDRSPAPTDPRSATERWPAPPNTPEQTARSADADDAAHATLDDSMLQPDGVHFAAVSGAAACLRIAKHGQSISECEDALALDPARLVLAVADGASSSFGAGLWAQILADEFIAGPPRPLSASSFVDWVERCRSAASSGGPSGGSGWWNEKGAEQGAFSTIVGAVVHGKAPERTATVMCLGDSCAFILSAGDRQLRRSLPYEDASQFGSHPGLVGSAGNRRPLEPSWTTIAVESGEMLLLASDAVSEWLLADTRRFSHFQHGVREEFADVLIAERSAGRIVNDDLTLVSLDLG